MPALRFQTASTTSPSPLPHSQPTATFLQQRSYALDNIPLVVNRAPKALLRSIEIP